MAVVDSTYSHSVAAMGTFRCPQCDKDTVYRHFVARRMVEVAGVSLVPLKKVADYVECSECRSTFISEVLDPATATWRIRPLQLQAAMRVMLLTMLADGHVAESELRKVAEVYTTIGGERLPTTAVRTQAEHARADPRGIEEYLEAMLPKLNEHGKLAIVKSAWEVAHADGTFQDEERALIRRVVKALHMRRDPLSRLGIQLTEA
jgi:uncharacterized tellurite resistance protein B-like protein